MSPPETPPIGAAQPAGAPWQRRLLAGIGWLCVGLGLIGAVLPLLPTTPFLLLAAACFARSSERWHRWLFANRLFGDTLRRYQQGEGMPRRARIVTLSLLWLSLTASAYWAIPAERWPLWLVLAAIGLAVSVHILRMGRRIVAQPGR